MPQRSRAYSLFFVLVITVLCGLALSAAASAFRELQEFNEAVNQKKNILIAVGLIDRDLPPTAEEIDSIYADKITSFVIDFEGRVIEGASGEGVDLEEQLQIPEPADREYPVYVVTENGEASVFALPVYGKGLWSTLYGYLALEADLNTVKGITFYDHAETPGLGAEITEPWFQENFVGKTIFDESGQLRSIGVVKGKVADRISDPAERQFYVDGISGASMTGRGVTNLLADKLGIYEPYLRRVWSQR